MKVKNPKKEGANNPESKKENYQPPKGSKKVWPHKIKGKSADISVQADWLLIRKKEKPVADIFYTYYSYQSAKPRPLTFVFNGGPGASSAYLHVGAMGPKTVCFGPKGECLSPPTQLKNNKETWMDWTDLVFVDPIGTGFSRSLEEVDVSTQDEKSKEKEDPKKPGQEFYKMNRDLEIIGEFVQQFLSQKKRWSSAIFIAGESYGGFRVAKLSQKLQEDYGVGLSGVIMISPCLELNALSHSDYNVLNWVEAFPTMFATACYHKKAPYFKGKEKAMALDLKAFLKPAEDFAVNELSTLLIQGEKMPQDKRKKIIQQASELIAISPEKLMKGNARLHFYQFCRLLLQKERKWCGMYDTSVTAYDPFPNRDEFEGADPTLSGIETAFSHGINILLREIMEINCHRQYRLINLEVNNNWERDKQEHFFDLYVGSTDDLRYAMTLNPAMKVFICHGAFDLITPYFSSERVIQLMNLPAPLMQKLSFQVFYGGHMFYTWERSRKLFHSQMKSFYSLG